MKFQLVAAVDVGYDGGDDYYHDFDPERISGAYRETKWVKSRWHEEGCTIHQKAVLNEAGEPVIKSWKEDRKPEKAWFKDGRNHVQVEQYVWEKEVERGYIYIDIDTLDDLIGFLRDRNGELGAFSYDPIDITLRYRENEWEAWKQVALTS